MFGVWAAAGGSDDERGGDGEAKRDGHDEHTDAEELPAADVEALATDSNEPEDRGEGAGDGEIGAEIDGDEDDPAEHRLEGEGAEG